MEVKDYHLLIVDDQAGVRFLLFEAFSDEGYQVEMAASGYEAIAIIKERLPSLILLDVKMPGMNGLETLQEIRKLSAKVPVVMMTAYGELEIMTSAKKLNVKHFINKPFDLNEVRYLVKAIVTDLPPQKTLVDIG